MSTNQLSNAVCFLLVCYFFLVWIGSIQCIVAMCACMNDIMPDGMCVLFNKNQIIPIWLTVLFEYIFGLQNTYFEQKFKAKNTFLALCQSWRPFYFYLCHWNCLIFTFQPYLYTFNYKLTNVFQFWLLLHFRCD